MDKFHQILTGILTRKEKLNTSMKLVKMEDDELLPSVLSWIPELILAAAISAGCWFSFFSMFPNPVNPYLSAVLIILLPPALLILCKNTFIGKYLVFYVFLIVAAMYMIMRNAIWNGFLVMINTIIDELNDKYNGGIVLFNIAGDAEKWQFDVTLAVFSVILLISLGIAHSIAFRSPLLGFFLSAIPVITGICLKITPALIPFIVLVISWAGLFAVTAESGYTKSNTSAINIGVKGQGTLPYIFIGITLIILLAFSFSFKPDSFKPSDTVEALKNKLNETIEHERYDNLNGAKIDQLSEGNLNNSHPLEYTDAEVLRLRESVVQPMHIRCFTGGYYNDGKWERAKEGAYSDDYTGVMEWLQQHNFYPWMQQDKMYRMSENYDLIDVEVENLNTSSKYIYLPYEAALSGDTLPSKVNYQKDYGAFAKGIRGQRSYTFKSFIPRMEDYDELEIQNWIYEAMNSDEWDEYAESEAVYRGFVYDSYLNIEDDVRSEIDALTNDIEGKSTEYVLQYIRKCLNENYTYDTTVSTNDLDDFINGSKSGNDMHFATLAALLFRSAGIPARYAEGYYITPSEVELYTETSDVSVHITDSYAHAWVEIYVDRLGWIPVEVIPGFYQINKHTTETEIEKEELKENNIEFNNDEIPDVTDSEDTGVKNKLPMWLLIIPLIILLVILYQLLGRRRVRLRVLHFMNDISDATAKDIYKYGAKAIKTAGITPADDPYINMDEISSVFDEYTDLSYEEYIDLFNRMRFGNISLSDEEQRRVAEYALSLANVAFQKTSKFKQFILKHVVFFV